MANDSATSERRQTDIKVVIQELETSFNKDPVAATPDLAEAYLVDGRPKDAVRILEKSGNGKVENQVLLAQALFDSFENARAAETIQAALKKKDLGNNIRAQMLLGELAIENNKVDEAKSHLRKAMDLDASTPRAAQLLRNLGEDIEVPELEQDDDDTLGFRTEDETKNDTAFKAIGQVVLVAALLGALLAGYIWDAKRNHAAKTLAVEAIPLVERGDIDSLHEAESKYNEILEIVAGNEYAVAGLAYLQALLWVDHGVDGAREKAIEYTSQATMDGIELGDRFAAEMLAAYGDGDLVRAEQIAKDVAAMGGVSQKLNWGLGLVMEKQGKIKIARENYRKAHDLRSAAPHYAVSLGDTYDATNDTFNAALYWSKAQASNSSYIPAAARELLVRIRRGEPKSKIEEGLKRLQGLPPELLGNADKAAIFESAAALAYREGDGKSTTANAQQGLAVSPENPRLLLLEGLGTIHAAEGEKAEDAKKAGLGKMKAAYDNVPEGTRYLYAYVDAQIDNGFYDEAITFIKGLEKKDGAKDGAKDDSSEDSFKTALMQAKLGNAYRLKKDYVNAAATFESALKLHKDYPAALLGQAVSFWNQRKYDDAIKSFENAVNAKTKFPEVYENIGLMFLEQGAPPDANTQLEEADRQYRAKGNGKRELTAFYTKVIVAFKAKWQTTIAKQWEQRLADLDKEPVVAAPAAAPTK